MSTGTSMKTGPGTPPLAISKAFSTVGPSSPTVDTVVAHLVHGRIRESWSMSWSEPRPFRIVAVAPPKRTIGDWAIWAFLTAVMVLVTPGPAVTAATPGRPVIRAVASAAKTAFRSSRQSTTLMPRSLAPMRMGEM